MVGSRGVKLLQDDEIPPSISELRTVRQCRVRRGVAGEGFRDRVGRIRQMLEGFEPQRCTPQPRSGRSNRPCARVVDEACTRSVYRAFTTNATSATGRQLSTLQPAPTHDRLSLTAAPMS